MVIDHITLAVPDLNQAQLALTRAGLEVQYGGVHSSGKTHMSLCSFGDGSYLEIVSPFGEARAVSLWHDHVLPSHGGSAWTVAVEDIAVEVARAERAGIGARGPIEVTRKRPDGTEGRWELGYLGHGQPGGTLPFLIRDFTARSLRVSPDPRFAAGWAFVVLAVFDVEAAAALFRRLYGWKEEALAKDMIGFEGAPVYLGESADFCSRFGEAPCRAVLRSARALESFKFCGSSQFGSRNVYWLDLPWAHFQLGVEAI